MVEDGKNYFFYQAKRKKYERTTQCIELSKENDLKKNFECGMKVEMVNTGSTELNGKTGSVIGKSFVNVIDHYIVLLDEPIRSKSGKIEALAVCMTESCLERSA